MAQTNTVPERFKELAQKITKEEHPSLYPLRDSDIQFLWLKYLNFLDNLLAELKQKP